MKHVFFIIISLLFSSSCFAQAEKDSLLLVDKDVIMQKLDLMFYLDEVGMEFWTMPGDEYRAKSNKKFPYYFINTIVRNNPTSINLKEYLGFDFKEFKPITWEDYLNAAYEKNITEFLALTKKYGFLSNERLNRSKDGKTKSLVTFLTRNSSLDGAIKRLLKKEKKIGNISEKEYEHFKFILKRKRMITNEDIAELEKKGTKMIFKSNP